MTSDAPSRRRWIGVLLCSALVLGACGSGDPEASSAEASSPAPGNEESTPSALALDEPTDIGADRRAEIDRTSDTATAADLPSAEEAGFDLAEFASLADIDVVEFTPEVFEQLKTNEASRAAILEEMEVQGLDAESAACFLDEVSPDLFMAFGTGQQPTDEQFGELLGLLDICEIAFGAAS